MMKDGERPNRPSNFDDTLWMVVQKCWVKEPELRPSIDWVIENIA